MRRTLVGIALALTAWVSPAGAADLQPFTADSLTAIKTKYAGRPFILSLWSVNWCGHCITELTMLGKLTKTNSTLPLVLVATDTPEFSSAIQSTLKKLGLAGKESWVFDDDIPERLRGTIDPGWYGDIPRTYLYDARHQRVVVVGVLDEATLKAWLKQQSIQK